ncbi:MAG: ATP-binding cassette domain-containing protein [Nitrospirae bacterium]|nr:ATP-binding cassette domain-containing protein [Nitrospirota bacterium]
MALMSLKDIRLAFGGPELLDGVTVQIDRGERVCLVGRNGAGKSTLMKIISKEITPDDGEVISSQGICVASLSQEVPQNMIGTVFEVVSAGLGNTADLLSEYHSISRKLADGHNAGMIAELERVQHLIESSGGWQIQRRVETVLSHLRLGPDELVDNMSGGYKRRVLLAKALVSKPDLLLLDEPTNHLDIGSIDWLEEFLKEFQGALLFITHDRRFLQTLATRIIELDRGRITDWPGDYAAYLIRRQSELDAEAVHNALFDKKLAQEEMWIRKGIKARRTRNEGRVAALEEMRRERLARRDLAGSAKMKLNEAGRSGKLVLEAKGITHSYEGRPLIRDFSTTIMRGDKIGIIGPNGSGKTTLLNILLGSTVPQQGTVRMGTKLEVVYFDQHREQLVEDRSVMDNVADKNEYVTVNGKTRHIIGYLEDFLFPPERSRSPVKVLSGGERNRALLAKIFTKPSNMLVMDEPTNDLDTDTLELLEEMLMDYDGTVLLVSHDREFLNNIVTSTIVFEGNGKLAEYVGGYDDWLRQRNTGVPSGKEKVTKTGKPRRQREYARTLSFKEKKELEALPALIETLEAERDGLYNTLAASDFYKQDGSRLADIKARIDELDREVPAAYERWEFLESI